MVKSLKDRMRARLPVAVAEVGDLDRYQVATVAVSAISNDSARCSQTLSAATGMARGVADAVLADVATEIVSFGHGGSGIRGGIEAALDEIERERPATGGEDEP